MGNEFASSGKVITVLGEISPEDLGFTLMHEHIFWDMSVYWVEPTDERVKELAHEPVSLDNLYWVRYHTRESLDELKLSDENVAVHELSRFKNAGGKTIVDLSSTGLGCNRAGLPRVSRAIGINVVASTGYYVGPSHGPAVRKANEKELAQEFIKAIISGVGDEAIRAGIIGELGCSSPLQDNELKVLRAAALAQRETGAPINIHPGRNERTPLDIIDVLHGAGANLKKVVMSHMDRCGYELETRLKLLQSGCYIEYDAFGKEGYYPSEAALADGHLPDQPNDVGRIKEIKELIELGFIKQLLLSQDVCLKTDLTMWGGPGYAHILENVVPLMRVYGMPEEQIQILTVENPKELLTIP